MKQVIVHASDSDEQSYPLFWSDKQAHWVDAAEATVYTEVPNAIPSNGILIAADEVSYFLNDRQGHSLPSKPCKCKTTECGAEVA